MDLWNKGPKLSTTVPVPTTSTEPGIQVTRNKSRCRSGLETCLKYIYNSENKTVCEKTCAGWLMVIGYTLSYFILLAAYTMLFLSISLYVIKVTGNIPHVGNARISDLYNYVKNGVGLSATPTSEGEYALIWYRNNEESDYYKYLIAIDKLIKGRNESSEIVKALGPCGYHPYGYSNNPCVIIRINKQLNWSGKPLSPNSTKNAPSEVMNWVKSGQSMLWLHCDGHHLYDREHIGEITYHPYPPGFDPNVFPLDLKGQSPLVAVQFTEYTPGVSVDVVCKLWYEEGPSSVHFTLYVDPQRKYNNSE